jgi:hypothetical protein
MHAVTTAKQNNSLTFNSKNIYKAVNMNFDCIETCSAVKISLHVVLHERETWSLTLREEYRVFENTVLRRIFGPKRTQVAGGWRRLHNEELHNLYASPNIIRVAKSKRVRWAGLGTDEKCIRYFDSKT